MREMDVLEIVDVPDNPAAGSEIQVTHGRDKCRQAKTVGRFAVRGVVVADGVDAYPRAELFESAD
jgi:hypothetical protein